jgi:hypothetical protein
MIPFFKIDNLYYFEDGSYCDNLNKNEKYITWQFSDEDCDVEYLSIYANKLYLTEICSEAQRKQLYEIRSLIFNQIKALKVCNISVFDNIFKYFPNFIIEKYLKIYFNILNDVKIKYNKPLDYDFIIKIYKLCNLFSNHSLKLDDLEMKEKYGNKIILHPFTITGRLSSVSKTFPILNLKKEKRVHIKPNNHYLLELDFNAADIRIFLALCGKEQPKEDVYEFLNRKLYNSLSNREDVKIKLFQILYSEYPEEFEFINKYFDISLLKETYFHTNYIKTPYNKIIECEEKYVISYLCQSTLAYILFESCFKINDFLKNRKSYCKFTIHDSLIIDLHIEDIKYIKEIKNIFCNTQFGEFMANVKIGKDFYNMEKIDDINSP